MMLKKDYTYCTAVIKGLKPPLGVMSGYPDHIFQKLQSAARSLHKGTPYTRIQVDSCRRP